MNIESTANKHKQHLKDFLRELREERFYDAHESLEAIWFPRRFENSDEVRLLKGFINAAVCFELVKKGKVEASEKVWKTYLKYKPLLPNISSQHMRDYQAIVLNIEKIKEQFQYSILT